MPLLWTRHPGSQYLDFMGRFWRIVHDVKENGVEEMILELMDDSGVMAKLPSKVHLTSHPICLRIREHSVYEDEKQRTWVHVVLDVGGDLQVRLVQDDIPIGDIALNTSRPTSSTMPSRWTLQPGSLYEDSMGRYWRIVHHVKEDGIEEIILELMDNS
ncbi:Protein p13 MTCP-1 [Myotis brandtii]|uniref:Protein p13 MTCP-1 n=1 Tax=Myotis brandtii TaxID=109478 RepID=S7PHP3_MYOBR|nr:Protein p13 MTCP-1 [Myotis brandtii]